jgi:Ser/Thr protein kinase RdoA (MazF antagonist)
MVVRQYHEVVNSSPLPVVHSLVSVGPLTSAITAAYGLMSPVHVSLLRSWTNDVYTVSAGDETYILKLYRGSWKRAAEVAWELELQSWLHSHGAWVTPVIPLKNGELFGTVNVQEGTRCFALLRKADGQEPLPPFSPDLYHQYGRSAALLHEASGGFSSPIPRFERSLTDLLDDSLLRIQPWFRDRDSDWTIVQRVGAIARNQITPVVSSLDWGVCHGDLSLDNLHVQVDGTVVFYDFDMSCYGWRAWDVCNALGYASPEHRDAFLAGYRDIRPFDSDANTSVQYFVAADVIRMMGDEVSRWSEWFGSSRVDAWMNQKLAWMREWEGEHSASPTSR